MVEQIKSADRRSLTVMAAPNPAPGLPSAPLSGILLLHVVYKSSPENFGTTVSLTRITRDQSPRSHNPSRPTHDCTAHSTLRITHREVT